MFLHDEKGVGAAPLLLGEMSVEVQEKGEDPSVPSAITVLNRHTSTSFQIRRHAHAFALHTRTHTKTLVPVNSQVQILR